MIQLLYITTNQRGSMDLKIDEIKFFRNKLRTLEREMGKQMKSETSCCGVTLAQCHILMELDGQKEVSIKELSILLELDKSTLSRTIDTMVNAGLLNRDINSNDRRYYSITLTQLGESKIKTINDMCNGYYTELFKYIPDKYYSSIIESISIVSEAMKEISKSGKTEIKNCCNM